MLTADTITDEQIRELRDALLADDIRSIQGGEYRECQIALGLWSVSLNQPASKPRVLAARARCAEILNARAAKSEGK